MILLVAAHAISQTVRWSIVSVLTVLAVVAILWPIPAQDDTTNCANQVKSLLMTRHMQTKPPRKVLSTRPTYQRRRPQSAILPQDGVIKSVTRSEIPGLIERTATSIPQTIWQTARQRNSTPAFGTQLFNSWTQMNPTWDHFFLDDGKVDAFVAAHYNETVLRAFRDMPLGVMRADAFRYMIVHQYGGVYADMDTKCHKPAVAWAPHGCHFSVGLETEEHFCQWAFAAVANHGALGRVLELVLQRMIARVHKDYIKRGDWEFVHEVTGPSVFTEGILDYLGVKHERHNDTNLQQLVTEREHEFRRQGVCLLSQDELNKMLGNQYSSWHHQLQGGSWISWTKERQALMDRAKLDRLALNDGDRNRTGDH